MTSTSLFGQVDKFDAHGKESFTNYLERLEFYFIANGIEDETDKGLMYTSKTNGKNLRWTLHYTQGSSKFRTECDCGEV